MMDLAAASKAVGAIAVIGGGALGLHELHTPRVEFNEHVASERVRTIFDLAKEAKESGSPDWLCRALDEEILSLCTRQPNHYICTDPDTKREIKAKAGCQ